MINVVLSESEQKVIDTLYEYFRETAEWMGVRTLHQKLGRKIVEEAASRKKYQLLMKYEGSGNISEHYKLTPLGIYLSSRAKGDIELVIGYLNLLKQKFSENPEIREVKSSEVETSLNLSKEQSRRLRDLIEIINIWSGSGSIGEEWRFGIPDDIEILAETGDPKEYLERHIEKKEERMRRYKRSEGFDKYQFGFWLLLIVILWREFFDITHYFLKILPYYVIFSIWFTLFSIAKILESFRIKVPFFSGQKVLEKIIWWVISIGISAIGGLITKSLSK